MKNLPNLKQQGMAVLFVCIVILMFMSVIAISGMRNALFDSSMNTDFQDVQLGADNCAESVVYFASNEIQRKENYRLASPIKILTEVDDVSVEALGKDNAPTSNACLAGFWNLVQSNYGFESVPNPDNVFGFASASVGGLGSGKDFQLSYLAVKFPTNCNPNTAVATPNNPVLNYKFYWVVGRCVVPYVGTKDAAIAGLTPDYTANKFALVIVTN